MRYFLLNLASRLRQIVYRVHIVLAAIFLGSLSIHVLAEMRPEKIHIADGKKDPSSYIRDALITGGDQAVNEVVITHIRRATNTGGFERIVIDLQGNHNGESVAIQRPPYYQAAVTPDEKRIVFTLFGKPKLGFNSKKVMQMFKRSQVIQDILLFPLIEENLWTFALELNNAQRACPTLYVHNPLVKRSSQNEPIT